MARVGSALLAALLAACGHQPPPAAPARPAAPPPARPPAAAHTPVPGQRTSYDNIGMYKNEVAEQVMRFNPEHTFSGQLPPMLPAIVVLSITVDKDGRMTRVVVQRSRDDEASKVALAAMQRSGPLPKPFNLIDERHKSLTFSETFLFNAEYRFQLRTLAGVQ